VCGQGIPIINTIIKVLGVARRGYLEGGLRVNQSICFVKAFLNNIICKKDIGHHFDAGPGVLTSF
jgi:hypothetical protein